MNLESPEKRSCVRNICILWICLNASWTVIRNAVPIILTEMDATSAPLYLGYFISTNALLATVISLAGGHLSDTYGRVAVLLPWTIYFASTSLSTLLGDMLKSVGLLWYARTGAISVPLTILNAMLSDFLRGDALLEAGGYIGTSQNLSVLLGTVMCGMVNKALGRGVTLLLGFGLSVMTCLFTAKLKLPRVQAALLSASDEQMRPVPVCSDQRAETTAAACTVTDRKTASSRTNGSGGSDGQDVTGAANTSGLTPSDNSKRGSPRATPLSFRYLDEEEAEVEVTPRTRSSGNGSIITSTRIIWRDPLVRLFALAVAITRMAGMNNNLMSVLFITRRFQWGLSEVSYLLAFASMIGALMQWKVLPFLIHRGWVYETLVTSVVVEALAMAGLAFAKHAWQLYVLHFASGVGAVSGTILNSRLSALGAEKGISGHVLGVVGFVQNGGEMFLANIFGAFLMWSMRTFPIESPLAGLPFIANGVLIFAAFQVINFANFWYGASRLPWSAASASRKPTAAERIIIIEESGARRDELVQSAQTVYVEVTPTEKPLADEVGGT